MPDTTRLPQILKAKYAAGPDQLRAHVCEMRQMSPAQLRDMNSAFDAFESLSDETRFRMMSVLEQAAETATVEAAPAEAATVEAATMEAAEAVAEATAAEAAAAKAEEQRKATEAAAAEAAAADLWSQLDAEDQAAADEAQSSGKKKKKNRRRAKGGSGAAATAAAAAEEALSATYDALHGSVDAAGFAAAAAAPDAAADIVPPPPRDDDRGSGSGGGGDKAPVVDDAKPSARPPCHSNARDDEWGGGRVCADPTSGRGDGSGASPGNSGGGSPPPGAGDGDGVAAHTVHGDSGDNLRSGDPKLLALLVSIGQEHALPHFVKEDVDFATLELCSSQAELGELLGSIGLTMGTRKKVIKAFCSLSAAAKSFAIDQHNTQVEEGAKHQERLEFELAAHRAEVTRLRGAIQQQGGIPREFECPIR